MFGRFILLFVIVATLAWPQNDGTDAYRGGVVSPPLAKPHFVLTDTSGAPFDFWQRTNGYVTLLFFGYTYCPDQCPMHMANLAAGLKKISEAVSDRIKLVFVTTDPTRDTLEVLRRWLDLFDKRFIGLTGSAAAIEAVERAAGVPVAKKTRSANGNYEIVHANFVLAYTKDNFAHLIYPGGVSKDDWMHDLRRMSTEDWSDR